MFNPNTPKRFKKLLAKIFDVPYRERIGKYLGKRIDEDSNKSKMFRELVDKLNSRGIQGTHAPDSCEQKWPHHDHGKLSLARFLDM